MKRYLFLTLAVLLCTLSASAYDFMVDSIAYYKNDDGKSVRVARGVDYKGDIVIPENVTYDGVTYSVTEIGYNAFYICTRLNTITIANSVTKIGGDAFYGCTGLTSVTIPNSVTEIGDDAFHDCTGLISVTIPNSVTEIGNDAFHSCVRLTSVTIPNSVTKIGSEAFRHCIGLTSITIGNSVTEIGGFSFDGCKGLTSVNIPNSVTKIGYSAFSDCTGLNSITIGNSVTEIGDGAFNGCTGLTSITIPNSVTKIGHSAFCDCVGLTSITIGNSVSEIGNGAFFRCIGLTSVTIPNSVTEIGNDAFHGCTGLSSIIFPNTVSIGKSAFEDTPWYNNQPDGVVYIGDVAYKFKGGMASGKVISIKEGTVLISPEAFKGCTGLTSVSIPNSVTKIGSSAFEGCTCLTAVTIPNSVTSIGAAAFSDCTGLTSITIPNSVTEVQCWAFLRCTGLTSVSIGNSVTEIDVRTFEGCTSLTSATIGTSVTKIGSSAFAGCTSLTSIIIPNTIIEISDKAFMDCTGLPSITIPNSVTKIGWCAFKGCTGLTSVTIGDSVTEICSDAFNGCTGLTSITIGNSVPEIGGGVFDGTLWYDNQPDGVVYLGKVAYRFKGEIASGTPIVIKEGTVSINSQAFKGCTGLTSVTIPNSVAKIGYRAFEGCTGLALISIGNSVTEICPFAFSGCTGLTSVSIPNSVTSIGDAAFKGCTGLTSVTIPNSVTSIGNAAFLSCTGLTSVTIGTSVTEIGEYAFSGCTGLSSVTIPNSVIKIGFFVFESCTGLTSITIGCSVTEMGTGAFSYCTDLKKVYSLNPVPPVIKPYLSSINGDLSFYDADLFVPQGCLSAYKSAKVWSKFSNIKEFQVTVKAESISLNKQSANLMIGETLSLTAKVLPENASTKTVVWSSNNPDVASVNDEGLVTALTTGTAIISATTTDGTVLSDSATIVVSTPILAPSLSVGNYVCVNGDIVTVALSLANKQEIGGFQTDFTVPEGFAVALNSKGKYDITLNADRCVDHVVTTNKLSDGSIRVLAYSPSAEPFIGESGEICYIKLVADEDVKEGDHQLIFREILISESNGKGHRCDDLTSVLSTLPVILGDVNNDHKVNVQDVLLTANVSVGKDVDGFVFRAADVNKDGIINVSDVVLVANIAVGNSVTVSAAPRFGESHDVLHVSDFMLNPGEERTVDVMLDNTVDFSALQMNLCLPAGVNLKKVALTGRATDGHAIVYNENTPGNINLMAFAASTENFTGNDGAILKLTFQADKSFCGEGAIELTDVKLAESDGYTREADDASARISAVATGVEGVYSVVCAYAEGQNIVIEATDAGQAQIVRPNGVMQEVKVNVGRNTYPMADGGIYFIRFAGKTFKVII